MRSALLAPSAWPAALFPLALVALACSGDTPTTPTDPVVTTTTEVFIGTLAAGETRFHTFNVTNSGNAEITLGSLTIGTVLIATPVTVGIGTVVEQACSTSTTVSSRPALTASLTSAVTAGTYCVNVADTNTSLTGTAAYSLRVVHP